MKNTSEVILRNEEALRPPMLILGGEDSELPAALKGQVDVLSTDAGALRAMETGARQVWFGYDAIAEKGLRYRTVVIVMPKSQRELELRIGLSRSLVERDGEIWLVGAKREGINGGARRFKEQVPGAWKRDSARHCQLWTGYGEDTPPCFDLASWYRIREVETGGQALRIADFPGVFSEGRLDDGTAMLLDTFSEPPKGPVLDFACGAGMVGSWLLGRWPELEMTFVDVQAQAVACTEHTLAANDQTGVVTAADGLRTVSGRFGTIVTNPPFHQGVKTDTAATERFIADCASHLVKGGALRLVANRFLPYPELIRQSIGPVKTLAENNRFCVYEATLH